VLLLTIHCITVYPELKSGERCSNLNLRLGLIIPVSTCPGYAHISILGWLWINAICHLIIRISAICHFGLASLYRYSHHYINVAPSLYLARKEKCELGLLPAWVPSTKYSAVSLKPDRISQENFTMNAAGDSRRDEAVEIRDDSLINCGESSDREGRGQEARPVDTNKRPNSHFSLRARYKLGATLISMIRISI
jgi:hypothetical protein